MLTYCALSLCVRENKTFSCSLKLYRAVTNVAGSNANGTAEAWT